jgi:copper chaperone CopZ
VKKFSILILAIVLGLILTSAPAFAGPGCGMASKGGGCAKTCATPCVPDKATAAEDKCEDASLVIKGMKDKDSETEITKALAKQDGFICVLAINHEDGSAKVCFDGEKINTDKILSTIKGLGFEVELASTAKGCPPGCDHSSPLCKKICPSGTDKK